MAPPIHVQPPTTYDASSVKNDIPLSSDSADQDCPTQASAEEDVVSSQLESSRHNSKLWNLNWILSLSMQLA